MISALVAYPEVKGSSVLWLGRVPAHWEVKPARALFAEVKEQNHPDEPLLSVTIARGIIRQSDLLADSSKKDSSNQDKSKYKLVKPGDVAYNKMRAWQGAVGYSAFQGIVSPAYIVQRPRDGVFGRFMHYLLRTPQFAKEAERWSYGITSDQWSLRSEHFKMIYCCLPPQGEQTAIVRFLDYVTRRISQAIRTKQKLIKLLEEEKQVIIHRGITRGLDPNVSLKPSGIENVGEIPQHWDVSRAGAVCNFISAKAHEQFVDPDGEHICVTARFVSTNGRSFRRCTENLSPARRNDVLMVMSDLPRGRALARAYLVNDDRSYAVNQRVCILRPVRVHPQFLVYAADRHPELLAHDDGFNQTHLPNAAFKTMHLPLPPLKEQMEIAKALARECMMREAVICRTEGEIDLLHEYRARLIADVVTGKLDVREAAKELPEEASDMEAADEAETLADDESAASDEMEETAVEEAEA